MERRSVFQPVDFDTDTEYTRSPAFLRVLVKVLSVVINPPVDRFSKLSGQDFASVGALSHPDPENTGAFHEHCRRRIPSVSVHRTR